MEPLALPGDAELLPLPGDAELLALLVAEQPIDCSLVSLSLDSKLARLAASPDEKPKRNDESKMPKAKYRDRRKQELVYLRQRVSELEQQLQSLAGVRTEARNELAELPWRSIAKRQLGKRERSEEENRRLKRDLTERIMTSQRLHRLVCEAVKREDVEAETTVAKSTHRWTTSELLAVQRFARELNDEYARVDWILRQHELSNRHERTDRQEIHDEDLVFSTAQAVPLSEGSGALYLDLQTASLIPFPFQRVSDAVWETLNRLLVSSDGSNCAHADENKLLVKLEGDSNSIFGCSTLLTLQRFVEKSRVVLVWRASCDDTVQSESLVTEETGWCVFESSPALGGGTLARSCVHAIPIPRDAGSKLDGNALQSLSETLAVGLTKEFKALKAEIEDALLEETVDYNSKLMSRG